MSYWQIAILALTLPLPAFLGFLGLYALPQIGKDTDGGAPYPLAGVGLLFAAGFFLLLSRILVGLAA